MKHEDLSGELFMSVDSGRLFVVSSVDEVLANSSISGGDMDLMSSSIASSEGRLDEREDDI